MRDSGRAALLRGGAESGREAVNCRHCSWYQLAHFSEADIFNHARSSGWLRPQYLILGVAVAALLGLSWLALDLSDRAAKASEAIERSRLALANLESLQAPKQAAGKPQQSAQAIALEWQSLERYRRQLEEDLRELRFAIVGAMAGNMLLLLFAVLGYRINIGARPARAEGQGQGKARSGISASPALLEDMSKLLQSSSDDADAYQVVQRCGAGLFAGCSGALYLAAEPGAALEMKTSWGEAAGSRSFAAADCWAVRRGEAYLAADPADIACRHLQQPPRAASLCVPVMGQGTVLGVLLLEDFSRSAALDTLRAVAKNFAGQIGLALVNMRLQETLRNLSVRDPLTGLFNRRYMEESLQREIFAARRKSRPLGVVICDLNQFKRFNDTFGRDAGDYALREIAQLIVAQIRSSDIACRYGEDEIAIILPEAPREGVVMRANQLREAISALSLEYFGRRLQKISASFGISLFPDHGKSSAELLQQAQVALSGAMEFGNNRVQVADTVKQP